MKKIMFFILIILFFIAYILYGRVKEIVQPIKMKKMEWIELFDVTKLNKDYVPQGIEVYKNYLLFTVHEKDKSSLLIVFKINNSKLDYLYKINFPPEATHVSDLSLYNNNLYAIDYASNNLYKIDIEKTINSKKLIVLSKIQTHLKRSGSIVVTNYNNEDVVFITQFILNKNIDVYRLTDLSKKNKEPIISIDSKYFIQGLYKQNNKFLISSNKYAEDPIFICKYNSLLKEKTMNKKNILTINGPGRMIEDVVIYDGYIITSDEETYKIYITKERIEDVQ